MRRVTSKATAWLLCLIMALTVFNVPAYAAGEDAAKGGTGTVQEETVNNAADEQSEGAGEAGKPEDDSDAVVTDKDAAEPDGESTEESGSEMKAMSAAGETITGSFNAVEGKDIATIRYYAADDKSSFKFAEFQYNESAGTYDYTFTAPYDGFEAVQGTSKNDNAATVIAEYYSVNKWDGAVDVSWYDSSKSTYNIGAPAELAGVAAIVNGSINTSTPVWLVKGERADYTKAYTSDMTDTAAKDGLPECIENKYYENTDLIAGVDGEAYKGLAKNDFANKTIKLTSDLDMGGVAGSKINQSNNYNASSYTGENSYQQYPNWTPIGGEYLMDPADSSTMIIAMFNGTLDGNGHHVKNLYCYRWSYAYPGNTDYTAYAYAQGTGLVGMIGSLYDGEAQPSVMPGVRNMSLSGYIFGRRMVGGFVGCMGGGSNAATGTSVSGVTMENLANHAYVYATDSKGLGGIVACSMLKGNIINCYNDGYLDGINYDNIPAGGIIGSNEGMNVYCCYNRGEINTHGTQHGRGIGGDNSGSDYTVSDCYYLNGAGDDLVYPGYRDYNAADSVSVTTTGMTSNSMKDGTFLEKLNVNGTAYAEGDDGYPVLWWEKHSGNGSLTISNPAEGGTVTASETGSLANGTIVFLSNEAAEGLWRFRYYTLNGKRLSGHYVTVNGENTVSGVFEVAAPGLLNIEQNDVCDITVKKLTGGQEYVTLKSGDQLYEGDKLVVEATLKEGKVPDDVNKQYRAAAGLANPYEYSFTYTGKETVSKKSPDFTVSNSIEGDDITLTVSVEALTTYKLWRYTADTSWYNDKDSVFTLTTAGQLAGLAKLVYDGNSFAGKTIKLGNDISLKNTDGTNGDRFWDGIGTATNHFSGTFDGQNHEVTDMKGSTRGLFGYCYGMNANDKAVIRNVTVRGEATGAEACGIAAVTYNAEVKNCSSYCEVEGTDHVAGIVSYAKGNSLVDNCTNYAGVSGKGYIGGIVGEIAVGSTVSNCANKGYVEVKDTGGNFVGGIAGSIYGNVTKCANYGHVLAYGRNIGGIVGQSVSKQASITDSFNAGNVEYKRGVSSFDAVGGLIGFGSFFKVNNCFNYGNVVYDSEDSPTTHIGGVIGREGRQSTSTSETVYYLDASCEYAEDSVKQEDLPDATYCNGIKTASVGDFANEGKVLAGINSNNSFVLQEGKPYPELSSLASQNLHQHSGGTATCYALAKCETCGVPYGDYDKTDHGNTVLMNASEPVWATDGYTGDYCCEDCGDVITKGHKIPADTDREAITISYEKADGNADQSKIYTVAEFDVLKKTSPSIAYSYGGASAPYTIEVASQYVTIERILAERGLKMSHVSKIKVVGASTSQTVETDILTSCNKYFESGKAYDAPAAIAIAYGSGKGTISQISGAAHQSDKLRFGYGISQEQFSSGESVGGKRLISPVKSITITLNEKAEEDFAAADTVAGVLGDLPEASVVTISDKSAIQAARTAFDALTEDQQGMVGSQLIQKLQDAEAAIAAIEKSIADNEAAAPVKEAIESLPPADDITLSDKNSVQAARDAYDALTDDQKEIVGATLLQTLEEAEAAVRALEKAEADKDAADSVVEMISGLPASDAVTLADKDAIQKARKAYNALTNDQKALISDEMLAILKDVEATITNLEKAKAAREAALRAPKVKTATLPLKVKQSIAAGANLTIASGDSVASVSSSNKKVLTVSGLKIKGKKKGTAKVTIRMRNGATISYNVKVQKGKVKGQIRLGCSSRVSLNPGGRLAINATKTPVTCTDKIKYSSKKKKVATVSGGVIRAKAKGTAKIIVKCGKKKKTIKVIVR